MMTISVVNIDEIGSKNADWYVILLEDNWTDPFRDELYANVDNFADPDVIGHRNWVVRGHSRRREEFFRAVFHRYRLHLGGYSFEQFPRPALLVTNTAPPPEETSNEEFNTVIRMIFPLAERYVKAGTVSNFLNNLAITLRNPDSKNTLETLNEERFVGTWGWILDCFEIKPGFLGVSVDVTAFLKHFLRN